MFFADGIGYIIPVTIVKRVLDEFYRVATDAGVVLNKRSPAAAAVKQVPLYLIINYSVHGDPRSLNCFFSLLDSFYLSYLIEPGHLAQGQVYGHTRVLAALVCAILLLDGKCRECTSAQVFAATHRSGVPCHPHIF